MKKPVTRYKIPISECVFTFLKTQGTKGATAREIAESVWETLGPNVPLSSIYSVLYGRLEGAKGHYYPLFERIEKDGKNKYRLIKTKK